VSEAVSPTLAAAEHAVPRSAARGFAKKPSVRAARDPGPRDTSTLRREPGGAKDVRARAVREASRSGSSAVKRVSLLRGDAEEVERFESGARGVGRLVHTSGRRILSAGTFGRREAFDGQAGQRNGKLPPEDAGEKDPARPKGAREAQGN